MRPILKAPIHHQRKSPKKFNVSELETTCFILEKNIRHLINSARNHLCDVFEIEKNRLLYSDKFFIGNWRNSVVTPMSSTWQCQFPAIEHKAWLRKPCPVLMTTWLTCDDGDLWWGCRQELRTVSSPEDPVIECHGTSTTPMATMKMGTVCRS